MPEHDLQALTDLLGLLAYGQLQAFDQIAADARLAPDLRRRAMIAEMAAAEFGHFRRLEARLGELGADPYEAMGRFAGALDEYHAQTAPNDWLEALVKAYAGDGIADDFYAEIGELLDPPDRALVLDVVHEARFTTFAANEIRAAIAADPKIANTLSMWARRLVGEAMSQAQHISAAHPSLVLLAARRSGSESPAAAVSDMYRRITAAHGARMAAAGLNT